MPPLSSARILSTCLFGKRKRSRLPIVILFLGAGGVIVAFCGDVAPAAPDTHTGADHPTARCVGSEGSCTRVRLPHAIVYHNHLCMTFHGAGA